MTHVAGTISVDAVLRGGVRAVDKVLVGPKRPKPIRDIVLDCRDRGIPVEEASEEELAVLDRKAGGVVAMVGERAFVEPGALWSGPAPFIAHLDGVEDPFNFGQAIRTLYAAGCDGVLLGQRNWMSATATVTRASAGASELMPMAVQPAGEAVEAAATWGAMVLATSDKADRSVHDLDLSGPLLVLFGGEKRGVTRSLLGRVEVVRIPYGRRFPRSLGTVAAASVVAFEVMRQRGRNDGGRRTEDGAAS